ncbi:MAG: N-6 DNA methylase, partial [Nanoarchaeales archaeon]
LKDLEEGGIFKKVGIRNFLEADYFAWYLDEWNDRIASAIYEIVKKLLDYEPATVELNPEKIKDLFKRLYQNLVPRDIRHKLGEYFTPDWLAELVLNEVGYDGNPDKRVLDPACGSGTFLVLVIKRIKEYAEEHFIDKRELLQKIINNVKGIDLNPLAVLASKANYLIALSDLLRYRPREGIEIPIYLADSIFVEAGKKWKTLATGGEEEYILYTTEGEFIIPKEIVDKNILNEILLYIDDGIKLKQNESEFRAYLSKRLSELNITISKNSFEKIIKLYKKIYDLEYKYHKNRIWTQLLKNSFAPLLIGKFDYVVGNPPWINWENLPEFYRNSTKELWDRYGLLEKTRGIGLGKVKRDISMLFVTRCFDQYLNNDGKLAFLVPFTLYKTQAGAGFRKWLANNCQVEKIHDLVTLYPFEGATNRTSLLVIKKGQTKFPIPCIMWHNPRSKGINQEAELEDVKKTTKQFDMILIPIKKDKPESPWMIINEKAHKIIHKIIKPSIYRAYAGVNFGGLDSVYYVRILKELSNEEVLIENLNTVGKIKVKKVQNSIEKDFVYPIVRGRDVKRWYFLPSSWCIIPTNEKGSNIEISKLKVDYPKTFSYFKEFETQLRERSLFKLVGKDGPFYGLYVNIGPFTFKPFKVAWKNIAGKISGKAEFSAAVITPVKDVYLGEKIAIPNIKLIFIPLENEEEAYYVCAMLNSSIAQLIVASYVIETGISTHILEHVYIPKFNPNDELHLKISELSKKAHELAKKYYEQNDLTAWKELKKVEEEIDRTVANLYGITDEELEEIKKTLKILREGQT